MTSQFRHPSISLLVLPAGMSLVLMTMYFFGPQPMQYFVAPDIPNATQGREFGVLENLQNLILLLCVVLCARGVWVVSHNLLKGFFGLGLAVFMFLLLEEIDYGLHAYEWLANIPSDRISKVRNLHNQGENLDLLKLGMNLTTIVVFGVLPIAVLIREPAAPWLRYFAPRPFFLAALVLSIAVSELAHWMNDEVDLAVHPLDSNISEFRELVFYYFVLAYVFELRGRAIPESPHAHPKHPPNSD